MSARGWSVALAFWLAVVLAAGCGGGDDGRTGIAEVDPVVDAVLRRDGEALASLVRYSTVECKARPRDLGGPPECRPGEPDGTPVEVLRISQCEGYPVRPDETDRSLAYFLDPGPELYAVFRAPETWERGEYVALFSVEREGKTFDEELIIEGGRVVTVGFGCGQTPEQLLEGIGADDVLFRAEE